jgi:hypothetical protein
MLRPLLVVALLVVAAATEALSAQPGELTSILSGLAERTQQYYDRFVSIICTETVHLQELKFNLSPLGKARITEYELNVSRDPRSTDGNDFRVERVLQKINGRVASKHQQPACTDPRTGTPEPLAFLLARNQAGYRFTLTDSSTGGPPGARVLHYVQSPPERVQVRWSGNCFEAEGGGHEGRVWFDPVTFDVLQVEIRLMKPFAVPLPAGHIGLTPAIRVDRSEATLRFARVQFMQPDETVLLPESIETLHVLRGVPSIRMTQTLNNYRRFLAESSIRSTTF